MCKNLLVENALFVFEQRFYVALLKISMTLSKSNVPMRPILTLSPVRIGLCSDSDTAKSVQLFV